jgi:hypothetical protein
VENRHLCRLCESGIPLDFNNPTCLFFTGACANNDESLQLIPEDKWPEQIAAMDAEETEFWKGRSVPIQLIVELPFWLLISDCEISLVHDCTTIKVSIRGQYMEVSDGPLFFNSHLRVIHIGPNDNLKAGKEQPPAVAKTQAPIYRPMKTVVIFRSEAMEDALVALHEPEPVTQQELPKIRRINRAIKYLQTLAYAHIPFLNCLIASYRFTSRDPFAFQVSQWDVPVWFAEHNGNLVRIGLMPYWNNDWYPTTRKFDGNERSAYCATSLDALHVPIGVDVTPGMMEILDAQSLLYRGHLDDAVRSAVTAIEVALESQITKLLTSKGWTKHQIQERLAETWNDFDKRMADYERIGGTRVPGPILSSIPYINGIRLKSELSQVRGLRHKIVHEGLRVDIHSRGPMLRAIETMTWLFHWLSWEEGKAQNKSRNYTFFEMQRGMHIPGYPFEYRGSGVVVEPYSHDNSEIKTSTELIRLQYLATIDNKDSDIELFAFMSFAYLGIETQDAPPPPLDYPILHERYHISHNEQHAIVFCLECDGFIDPDIIRNVNLQSLESEMRKKGRCSTLCIINHQRQTQLRLRKVEEAISDEVNQSANEFGITLITAPDLRFLVQGEIEHKWDADQIRRLLFIPGRQGLVPPEYHGIGTVCHFYDQLSVMSVDLYAGETVKVGQTLGIRLQTRYHEETIESLQVGHKAVSVAIGPCKVGMKTILRRAEVDIGQAVFIRFGQHYSPQKKLDATCAATHYIPTGSNP